MARCARAPDRLCRKRLEALEPRLKAFGPAWLAYDMRLMMRRYQQDGATATDAEIARLTTLLGHVPRSYRDLPRVQPHAGAGGCIVKHRSIGTVAPIRQLALAARAT